MPLMVANHQRLQPVLVALVLCSLVAQVIGKGGGGGSAGGGGYSSAAAGSGGKKAAGRWGPGGASTAGGSAVVNNGGRAMSTRPRFYNGGGAYASRAPIFLAAGLGAGYMYGGFYRGGAGYRDCSENGEERFQYGRSCRKCSDWECPVGQYRSPCTPDTDSYCKLCTNKPEASYVYTSPGNDNDCEYAECTTDAERTDMPLCDGVLDPSLQAEFAPDSPAEVVFYSEVPLDASSFNEHGATYKQAISELAGGAEVTITEIEPVPSSTFTRRRLRAMSAMMAHAAPEAKPALLETGKCSAPLPSDGGRECVDTCTSPGGDGGYDCWAGNGEPYTCDESYESYELTGETVEWEGQTWNGYKCCSGQLSVVVVETTVWLTSLAWRCFCQEQGARRNACACVHATVSRAREKAGRGRGGRERIERERGTCACHGLTRALAMLKFPPLFR
jgi:hypothetical protein